MSRVIIKNIRKLLTKLLWLLSIFIILFVLILSLFKLALPYWLKDKERVEGYIEQQIGGDFNYTKLSVDWSKFKPLISLEGASWKSNDGSLLISSNRSDVSLRFWQTLYFGYLRTENVSLSGLNIDYLHASEQASKGIDADLIKLFFQRHPEILQQENILISDLSLKVSRNKQAVSFTVPRVKYQRIKQERQLVIQSYSDFFNKANLVIESQGWPLSQGSRINLFADITHIDTDNLYQFLNKSEVPTLSNINVRSWVNLQGDEVASGRLEVTADGSDNNPKNLDAVVNFKQDQQLLSFETEKFILNHLPINAQATESKPVHSYFSLQQNKLINQWDVAAKDMPIEYLVALGQPFLSGEQRSLAMGLKPSGLINKVQIALTKSDQGIQTKKGIIELNNFSINEFKQYPGIELDSVVIENQSNSSHWNYSINAQEKILHWSQVFKEGVDVQNLKVVGDFDLLQKNEDITINVRDFVFTNADAKARAYGAIRLKDDKDVELSLYAEGSDINIKRLEYYWPRNVMQQEVLTYLEQSLQNGVVDFAKMIWRGTIEGFPYQNFQGQFDTQAWITNASLKFDPDWPQADGIKAHASFINDGMYITASEGRLTGNILKTATAQIVSFSDDDSSLNLTATANSTPLSYSALYSQSPLKEWLGSELESIIFEHSLESEIELNIPLGSSDDSKVKLKGLTRFSGNSVTGLPYAIQLNNVFGELHFTENGAYTNQFSVELWGSPVDLELKAADFAGSDDLINIKANSNVNFSKALSYLQIESPLNINGNSDVFFNYRMDNNEHESIIVRSQLHGTQIDGPSWLSKSDEEISPALVTVAKLNNDVTIRAIYRDSISSQIKFNSNATEETINGVVALGNLATTDITSPDKGIAIEGHFDEVVAKEWLNSINITKNGDFYWPQWIERIRVQSPLFEVAGQKIHDVQFSDDKLSDQSVRFNVTSQEGNGHLTLFADGRKHLTVEHLNIQLKPFSDISDNEIQLNQSSFYDWQFECQSCVINGIDTGVLTLVSSKNDKGVFVQGDSQVNGLLSAYLEATWYGSTSNLSIDFETANAGRLLQHWGYGDGLKDAQSKGKIALDWRGGFHEFELSRLNGSLTLDTEEGVVKELSDKQARIFSLLSLQSLRRRLSLDFSDLFQDGFFFDEIDGNFSIKNGLVYSDQVKIKGAAADVVVSGYTNLVTKTVDQNVLVSPKISSSLPILAGWALEPTTGLIMLLVNKIFEPVIDVVVSLEYKITGSLSDPKVIELDKKSKEIVVPEEELIEHQPNKQSTETETPSE